MPLPRNIYLGYPNHLLSRRYPKALEGVLSVVEQDQSWTINHRQGVSGITRRSFTCQCYEAMMKILPFISICAMIAADQEFGNPVPNQQAVKNSNENGKNLRILAGTSQRPAEVTEYEIFTSEEIEDRLTRWAMHYTDLVRLTTAQDEYDFPRAGGPEDCPFIEGDGCPNSILTIQDFIAHPEGSKSSNELPEVLWSGEVHGNEQVGPTSVMQATELLLEATSCIALPRLSVKRENPSAWKEEVEKAKDCRDHMLEFGISEQQMWWLARLVSTRRIVVVPTANSLGYFRSKRTEGKIDPNRDFPFDYTKEADGFSSNCMQTIAARTLNEVFREHMFQLSLTFHGGMEVIGYEWGAPSYSKTSISPDDTVQHDVAAAYSRCGGGWSTSKPYNYGPMNPLVYPVRGGMEDWAYAGSWDPDRVVPCNPGTFGGYPTERTIYNNATLRVLNMLVETSDDKIPKDHLGSSWDLLDGFSIAGNGHISRNIRLALLAAELVQPWLSIRNVNEIEMTDDIIPMIETAGCQDYKLVSVPQNSRKAVIEWIVGGSLNIDDTKVWYAKWSDVPELGCSDQPHLNIQEKMREGTPISKTTGKTGYASTSGAKTAHFSASLDLTTFGPDDKIVVMVSARVDQSWLSQPDNIEPNKKPQSHMANARTNPDWYFESEGKVIQGRVDWFSRPLTIEFRPGDSVETIEVSERMIFDDEIPTLPPSTDYTNDIPTSQIKKDDWSPLQRFAAFSVVLAVMVGTLYMLRRRAIERRRQRHRRRLRNYNSDDDPNVPNTDDADEEFEDEVEGYDDVEENGVEMGSHPS